MWDQPLRYFFSLALASQDFQADGFAYQPSLPAWTGFSICPLRLPSCVTPSLLTAYRRYRNFHRLSIAYAFQPRLRSRLTLGGRAFPRKPQASGGQDSHLPSRLLIPAFSLPVAPAYLSVHLLRPWNAPLPTEK